MNKLSIEKKLVTIESYLNIGSCLPLIGALPALAKAGLGIIQLTSAIAIPIFTTIPTIFGNEKARDLFFYSWTHMKHGVGNIYGGLIQTIPLLTLCGWILWISLYNCEGLQLDDRQPFKFMVYPTIAMEEGYLACWRNDLGGSRVPNEDDQASIALGDMPAKEALKLGLIDGNFNIDQEAVQKLFQEYLLNDAPIQGKTLKEREKKRCFGLRWDVGLLTPV
jgi:hypothetical protein